MREHKYRIWDTPNKMMITEESPDYSKIAIALNGAVAEWDDTAGWRVADSLVPLEYTGLHDKAGVEIYEGDVVRGMLDYGPGGFHQVVAPISWDDLYGWRLWYFQDGTVEVIGNIYQNPELLDEAH